MQTSGSPNKSRNLRRRLLLCLIFTVAAAAFICLLIFRTAYSQTGDTVAMRSAALTERIVSISADAFYQRESRHMEDIAGSLGTRLAQDANRGVLLAEDMTDPELLQREYLSGITEFHYTLFVSRGGSVRAWLAPNARDEQVLAVLEELCAQEGTSGQPLSSYLDENCGKAAALRSGDGTIAVWFSLQSYLPDAENVIIGMVAEDQNEMLHKMKLESEQETKLLIADTAKVMRRYRMILLLSIAVLCIGMTAFAMFISKQISEPIVSEHNMLVKLNEMKTTFLSDASHELKTPLAAMSGYAQNAEKALMHDAEKPVVQEKLRRITLEANRMAMMVTQILDATRIEEGRMILEQKPCDLEGIVRETVETYYGVLNKNNNRLAIRIPVEFPQVYADRSRLQRVFVNLISNALKHTHDGMIVIKAEEQGEFAQITVKDTGSGILPEDLPHIWERYYKGKHSETGTGLGLFICKFIVESHGGTITVESEVGKGTAFILTIPFAAESNYDIPDPFAGAKKTE